MKDPLHVTIGVVIGTNDDTSVVITPPAENPLDELADRLRKEAVFGRDFNQQPKNPPKVVIGVAVTCQGCPNCG